MKYKGHDYSQKILAAKANADKALAMPMEVHFDLPFTLARKIAKFQFHETSCFFVGSAHVRSQATVHAFMQYAWGPRILIHVSKSARS